MCLVPGYYICNECNVKVDHCDREIYCRLFGFASYFYLPNVKHVVVVR